MKEVDVIIVGAGPTGLFCSVNIYNKSVLIIDANEKIGGKIKVSGGGRCNVGNNKNVEEFLKNIYKNEKFLYPTFNNFNPKDLINYFNANGVHLKEEEDNKMFPLTNDSRSFINYFQEKLELKDNVEQLLGYKVNDIKYTDGKFVVDDKFKSKYLVVATGGISYPHISHGIIGHNILESLGHSISELKPASTSLVITDEIISSKVLQGISIKGAVGEVYVNNKKKKTLKKDIIFTHFGLSGPLALDLSCFIKEQLDKNLKVRLKIRVDAEIPRKLKDYLDGDNSITFSVSDVKGFKTAFVTNGGISLKEVDPKTLQSKIINNLYIGGEILDIHAITGGYNISICFSEGKLIGGNINER